MDRSMILNVLRTRDDCTNGGASATAHMISVSAPGLRGPGLGAGLPAFTFDMRGSNYPVLVPVEKPEGRIGPMFGGNFAYSSDSRWCDFLRSKGLPTGVAIPIHDRFETPAQYRSLSI